ncbi:MAG: 5'-nucleotidase, lipoprotein e(P4) family [Marinicellaceae bacterium]
MNNKISSLLLIIVLLTGCSNKKLDTVNAHVESAIKEHLVQSVLWQQNAAEYKALCYQAFNMARMQLVEKIKNKHSNKPFAIITDIDETILDNSPYSAWMIDKDQNYDRNSWISWGKKESATLVPGAAEFLKFVQMQGVEVFYVSNRYDAQIDETINNLKKYNLPNVDRKHVILRSDVSGKEIRRQKVSESHDVLMLLGDNLSDFHHLFDHENSAVRNKLTDNMKSKFGTEFIVFPNPIYGDWEVNGIFDGKRLTESEKRTVRKSRLIR